MIKPKRIYYAEGVYSFHGAQGIHLGELTLYEDNRIVGTMNDKNLGVSIIKMVVGIYDPFYDNIELVKTRNERWAPILWKLSKNNEIKRSPFLKELREGYTGKWDLAKEDSLNDISVSQVTDCDRLKEINIESLKAFFNLHDLKMATETGTLSFTLR